ncbi:MAG: hypothetical protein R3F65_12655 [bacterium]
MTSSHTRPPRSAQADALPRGKRSFTGVKKPGLPAPTGERSEYRLQRFLWSK